MIDTYIKKDKRRQKVTRKRLYDALAAINEFGYNVGLARVNILPCNFNTMRKTFKVELKKNKVMVPISGSIDDLDVQARGLCEVYAKHQQYKKVQEVLGWSRTKLMTFMSTKGLEVVTKYYFVPLLRGEKE